MNIIFDSSKILDVFAIRYPIRQADTVKRTIIRNTFQSKPSDFWLFAITQKKKNGNKYLFKRLATTKIKCLSKKLNLINTQPKIITIKIDIID